MNKTVSINLGGLFFHIDEDAYQKLNNYFDAIRRSLSPDGKDEIMSDIEGRIAELLSDKMKNDKQVVGTKEIDEIISVMGEPEDYRLDDEEPVKEKKTQSHTTYEYIRTRKFYRDEDNSIIAGVCAGLAHYFRIDPLWIRILFIVSPFISFGTSIIIYILLWVLIPKAITTTEKLEMRGEPINISNIEKKVKEEINVITEKLQKVDYDRVGNNIRSGADKVGNALGSIISAVFKAVGKVIGAFITVFSALTLGGLIVMLIILLFSSSIEGTLWYPYINSVNYTHLPIWTGALAAFFVLAIPCFTIFLAGLKILVTNLKPISSTAGYVLAAIWVISLSACIYLAMYETSQLSNQGKDYEKHTLEVDKNEVLNVKFRFSNYYAKDIYYNDDYRFVQDTLGNPLIYSNKIRFYVMETDEEMPYVQIEKLANGHTLAEASKTASRIKYHFSVEGNTLNLDNYLLYSVEDKYKIQRVEIILYLPEGMMFQPDKTVRDYDCTNNNFFDLWYDDETHLYMMEKNAVKCIDCIEPTDEAVIGEQGDESAFEEPEDIETDTINQ
ncbi:PspC domain-containing protein [Flavobacterium rhizosphaerae]|uniref:PspC domain-containing protein n=1 Tax=Flavobacterium rhizosphaerae TaxID=3163298 RepID=A0ABW8YX28_9FLAO